VDLRELEGEFAKLEAEARERLEAEEVPPERMSVQRLIDMRYLGQWRSLTIPVDAPTDVEAAVRRFHDEHFREYNYRREGTPVEIYRVSVRAVGATAHAELARHETSNGVPSPRTLRAVRFHERDGLVETPVYARSDLGAGTALEGPAVIEQLDSTTVIPPGWHAEVDEWLNIRMQNPEVVR
jgi:N-methylhydantoinase A